MVSGHLSPLPNTRITSYVPWAAFPSPPGTKGREGAERRNSRILEVGNQGEGLDTKKIVLILKTEPTVGRDMELEPRSVFQSMGGGKINDN